MLVKGHFTYLGNNFVNLFTKFDLHLGQTLVHVVMAVVLYVIAGTSVAKYFRYLGPLVSVLAVQEEQGPAFCLAQGTSLD